LKLTIRKAICLAIIIGTILSGVFVPSGVFANDNMDTIVSLDPSLISGSSAQVGNVFTVTAKISNVKDLWGWSLGLTWDSSILQMLNYDEGAFLKSKGSTIFIAAPIDNSNGVIQNVNNVLSTQTNITGSGNLVSFTFKVVGIGETEINLVNVQLMEPLSDSGSNNQIVARISNAVFFNIDIKSSASLADTVFRAVQSGTTSSNIQAGPSPDPLGTTITVDIRVDSATVGIWGWNIATVSWNPSVLNLTKVQPGTWLDNNTPNGDPTQFVGNSKSLWNYSGGYIMGGISQAIQGADVSIDSSGVIAILTFAVVGYGTSPVTIGGGTVRPSSSTTTGTPVTCNSATVTVLSSNPTPTPTVAPSNSPNPTGTQTPTPTPSVPPAVHGPQAVFTPANGTQFPIGSDVVLDASSSTPGFDVVTCPITNYAWLVQYQNGTIFGSYSAKTVTFNATYPTLLKVTLLVTAPDLNTPRSPSYIETSTTFSWIQISTLAYNATIKVTTDKGGQSTNGGIYGPQELVRMRALVNYNGVPVVNKQVAFAVASPNGTVLSITSSWTNQTGYADWQFRLPWLDDKPQALFGNWTIVATVDVAQVTVTDSIQFTFNYLLDINGLQMLASMRRSQLSTINVTLQSLTNSPSVLTITVYDEQKVPVAFTTTSITSAAGTTVTATIDVAIPSWAYVGKAAIYVDVLTKLPTLGGVPLCPEKSANFQIIA
jgi:hypothetical protein